MTAARTELPKLTDRIALGTTGLHVSPVCIGTVLDPSTIPAAFEAGINFFFITADMHWLFYEHTRRGLRMLLEEKPSARDEIIVAGVSYLAQPEFLWVPFEEILIAEPSLKRLDLTIAGGCYGHELPRRQPVYEQHRTRRHLGVRGIGASFHDRAACLAAVNNGPFDIAFVRYNPEHPKARAEVFPHVAPERRARLFNFKSSEGWLDDEDKYRAHGIGTDMWRPHVTDYYRFALTEPALDGILCALPGPSAVRELADALAKGPLDDEDRQYLLDLGDVTRGRARLATSGDTQRR